MVQSSNVIASKFISLVLVLSFLLIISMADSRQLGVVSGKTEAATVSCDAVYGQKDGNTCYFVAQKFKLSTDSFLEINPNINCDAIFVGQWLCVYGSVSPGIEYLLKHLHVQIAKNLLE
ncbi:hypothetical protein LguiA_033497 [Lonicera macranthoides]